MLDGLPGSLLRLLADADWATHGAGVDVRVPPAVVKAWDPEAPGIHLESPRLLADEVAAERAWWDEVGALATIDPHRHAVIGDFGLGSDSPITVALGPDVSVVSRLAWQPGGTRWVRLASDFDAFLRLIRPDL